MTAIQEIQQIDRDRLVRANESQRQRIIDLERKLTDCELSRENAVTFARLKHSDNVTLTEQLREAKQLIETLQSALKAWQE